MPFLRNVLKDLVDKRLWPVAALLVAALVAVPVVLGRSGDDATTTAALPATGAGTSTNENASVTLETTPDDTRHDGGQLRDPFHAPKVTVKKVTDASSTTAIATDATSAVAAPAATGSTPTATVTGGTSDATTTTSSSPSSGSTGASGSDTTETTPKPKTTTTTGVAEDAKDTYHVSVRFGRDGGKLTTTRDVARLSPLPSATDPFFVYLGVLETTATKKEKRAVFVVTSDATPNGEGACHPTKNDCESVELTVGQTVYFDYTDATGKVSQYELQLAGIHKTEIKSEAKASAAIARHSIAGTELLRDAATRNVRFAAGARAYRYLPAAALLQRAKRKHITAKAAAAGAIPGIELVDAKDQPGLPVWRSPEKHK